MQTAATFLIFCEAYRRDWRVMQKRSRLMGNKNPEIIGGDMTAQVAGVVRLFGVKEECFVIILVQQRIIWQ